MIELLNTCCMKYMATQPDNAFDLAIVDPPYTNDCTNMKNYLNNMRGHDYNLEALEGAPDDDYFMELMRVSKEQIIWGGNYFPSIWRHGGRGFVFWFKKNPVNNFADGELAWTSFDRNAKCFEYQYYGNLQGSKKADNKIHPTQKPLELYSWLLTNYAEKGQRILDTHLGSGSSAIAAHYFGADFIGCELDEYYFKAAKERFDNETRQVAMF